MKGMLASGALMALDVPTWAFADSPTRRPKQYAMLLGGFGADDAFVTGARAACRDLSYEGLEILRLNGGLFAATDAVSRMLSKSRGTRWMAVFDDAGAVLFKEVIRTLGVRLFAVGSHAFVNGGSSRLRHDWVAASKSHTAAGLLASHLLQRPVSFAITEHCLQPCAKERSLTSWSAPGFSSYRSDEAGGMHLHCSGLSVSEGCEWIGLADGGWMPIPLHSRTRDAVNRRSDNWVESVGYVVAAKALGVETVTESCSARAFLYGSPVSERPQPTDRFVSFVMDV
jgi:hypothetical protein